MNRGEIRKNGVERGRSESWRLGLGERRGIAVERRGGILP